MGECWVAEKTSRVHESQFERRAMVIGADKATAVKRSWADAECQQMERSVGSCAGSDQSVVRGRPWVGREFGRETVRGNGIFPMTIEAAFDTVHVLFPRGGVTTDVDAALAAVKLISHVLWNQNFLHRFFGHVGRS